MYRMIAGLLIVAAGIAGYFVARSFVRRRLRFVDAIYSPLAPWIAGTLAALSMWPVALLPLVSGTTAVVFGLADDLTALAVFGIAGAAGLILDAVTNESPEPA